MVFKSFFNFCARHSSAYLDLIKQLNQEKIYNQEHTDEYAALYQDTTMMETNLEAKRERVVKLNYQLERTLDLLREAEKKIPKIQSLEDYKINTFNKLHTYVEFYDYDGTGKKPVYKVLELNDEVKEYYNKALLNDFTGIWKKFKTADQMVYKFVDWFYKKEFDYLTDKKNYGKLEYWAKAIEALEALLADGDDCEGHGVVMYASLYYLLDHYGFKNHQWRVQCLVVLTRTGGGHFVLGWLKKNICDWVVLESTYFKETFYTSWHEDITLKKNLMYRRILYSFDHKTCRKKLE